MDLIEAKYYDYPLRTNRDYVAVVNDLMEAFVHGRDMAGEFMRRAIEKGIAGLSP
ncbi:MAG: hypothetical protein AAF266_02195 [Planctomycetota bacterium]